MTSIDSVLSSFTAAEQALQKIILESESLSSAETRIDNAFTSLKSADKALADARAVLDNTAERTGSLAETLEATAEQFRAAAQALNEINPAEIAEVGQQTQAELHKLGSRLQQVFSEQNQEALSELRALGPRVEDAIQDADTRPAVEAAKLLILQGQAEQSETFRARVDDAVTLVQNLTAQLESKQREYVRRQNLAIACSLLAGVLALITLAAVLAQ